MPVARINDLEIACDIVGSGNQHWAITPGGRFSKDYGGVRELAEGLADSGRTVLIWDRPNCGASSVAFTGSSESALQADTLAELIRQLDFGPAVIAGGSGGSRISLLTVARNPDIAKGLAMWWISGGIFGLMALGWHYCGWSIDNAWKYDMAKVADLPDWQEVIERNPGNRDRFLAMDRLEFLETMQRWMAAYAPPAGQTIPGIPNGDIEAIPVPTIVFRSGESDPAIRGRRRRRSLRSSRGLGCSNRRGVTASGSSGARRLPRTARHCSRSGRCCCRNWPGSATRSRSRPVRLAD
jgi:pimeloyl-ACP methyl ester carboxylesterase